MKHHHPPPESSSLVSKASTAAVLLLPLFLITLLFLAIDRYEFQPPSVVTSGCDCEHCHTTTTTIAHFFLDPVYSPKPALRIFIGILTRPDTYERRHLLRSAYAIQPPCAQLRRPQRDVLFVLICNLTTEEQGVLVALESLRYDDVVILNCSENLDDGKTFTYFSSLPSLLKDDDDDHDQIPCDYVIKADDVAYIRLDALETALWGMPREERKKILVRC